MLGEDDGSGLVELPEESFYDAFPGSVVPEGTNVTAVFSIDMSNVSAFDAAEDSVYLRTHDKWLNLSQGFSDGQDFSLGQLDHPRKFMDLNFTALYST